MTNLKRVKTLQVTTNINLNWQLIHWHPHNLPFSHFAHMATGYFLYPSIQNVGTPALTSAELNRHCIPTLDGGHQRMAIILRTRRTGSSLAIRLI